MDNFDFLKDVNKDFIKHSYSAEALKEVQADVSQF